MKYIFVTGGVVSSLGKGLAAASLGTLLEHRGLKVTLQKFDPYLNVDPGTMSPYEHGEVYVLDDGAETDLDLGHYERFTNCVLSKHNNLTSGQVYLSVIEKERRGEYLGETIQVIPHVTDAIKERINEVADASDSDIIITEIGGTVGDIEGQPYLEAMRQFAHDVGPENVLFVHVTFVPYLEAAGEMKTKPTQQSVAKLREIGIMPQMIVLRSEREVVPGIRAKIGLFCNVKREDVIRFTDIKTTIYEAPMKLRSEGFDQRVCDYFGLDTKAPDYTDWEQFVQRVKNPSKKIRIAVVGKYTGLQDAYKSIYQSLMHAGAEHDCKVKYKNIVAEELETDLEGLLSNVDGILIPGGFGDRGIEGKIAAAKYARENKIPYFGLCLGMQIASIEFARNVCGLEGANSTEFKKDTPHPVICLMEEQEEVVDLGGSMRLGAQKLTIKPGTKAHALYGEEEASERHRHRWEFNQKYREQMESAGLVVSGTYADFDIVEMIELADHPYFVACQFHPEFQSKPNKPHPLFSGFVAAAVKQQEG